VRPDPARERAVSDARRDLALDDLERRLEDLETAVYQGPPKHPPPRLVPPAPLGEATALVSEQVRAARDAQAQNQTPSGPRTRDVALVRGQVISVQGVSWRVLAVNPATRRATIEAVVGVVGGTHQSPVDP
jgi:hypothetical protein